MLIRVEQRFLPGPLRQALARHRDAALPERVHIVICLPKREGVVQPDIAEFFEERVVKVRFMVLSAKSSQTVIVSNRAPEGGAEGGVEDGRRRRSDSGQERYQSQGGGLGNGLKRTYDAPAVPKRTERLSLSA